jgi:hypothetical protein
MTDYDPGDPSVPISWMTPNAYIPDMWRRRDAEYWRTARDAMSRTWTPQPPPYHEELLESARRLIAEGDDKKYQLAVVLVQAACETLTEQVVAALIAGIEPASLREWIDGRVRMRNDLDDDRVRDLYVALTGDDVKKGEGLWQQYGIHVRRRHGVVHGGKAVSKEDATHSYRPLGK